jgi:hypothetical protein
LYSSPYIIKMNKSREWNGQSAHVYRYLEGCPERNITVKRLRCRRENSIVTWRLKAGVVEQEETAVCRQRRGKHVSRATNQHTTIKEMLDAMFSMRPLSRLYSENQQHGYTVFLGVRAS